MLEDLEQPFRQGDGCSRAPLFAMSSSPRSSHLTLARICLAGSAVVLIAVHSPLLAYKAFANVDEAYAAALASRLLDGYKLYDGAVSQRGPLMYYAYEAIAWLHGWDNIVALRLWSLAFALAHVGTVYWAARTLFSDLTAAIAVLIAGYALAFGVPAHDAYALHGESLQLPAMMVGVILGAFAVRAAPGSRRRRLLLAVAGLAFGVAVSIKQSVALQSLPLVIWLALDGRRRRAGVRGPLVDVLVLVLATAAVPLLLLAHAAAQGTLSELYYWTVTYNAKYHLRPTTKAMSWLTVLFTRLIEETGFFIVVFALAGRAAPTVLRRVRAAVRERSGWAVGRGFGTVHYFALHFVFAMYAASAMYRFFPHYYIQALPFLALCLAAVAASWLKSQAMAARRAMLLSGVAFLLLCGTLGTIFGEKVDGRVAHDRSVQDCARAIEATTRPEDKIFVWGFSPWLYEYSHRKPAGRYVFGTYVTGFIPWFWEKIPLETSRIVPGSVEALLGDLDREKPEIVVDAGSVMMARPMRSYDLPARWLREHYCFEYRLGAFDLYRRKKTADQACAVPWFPKPHFAVDWNSRGTVVLLARVVDPGPTKRLPVGSFKKPIWFLEGPRPPPIVFEAVRLPVDRRDDLDAEESGYEPPAELEVETREEKP
jgi:Dolichyl-phosphate-mannose-protein mannosyltransferase